MGTDSSNGDGALTPPTPTDQSGSFLCGEGQAIGVAEAALQDGENEGPWVVVVLAVLPTPLIAMVEKVSIHFTPLNRQGFSSSLFHSVSAMV